MCINVFVSHPYLWHTASRLEVLPEGFGCVKFERITEVEEFLQYPSHSGRCYDEPVWKS